MEDNEDLHFKYSKVWPNSKNKKFEEGSGQFEIFKKSTFLFCFKWWFEVLEIKYKRS